ncbi:MAG TPA: helix-turn-helix domain-containing protein, partial [Steroidobacteraceae bacterium]|nr:helix-turn-helix domain-containing protein [Steroidobacteraceae bacterium]
MSAAIDEAAGSEGIGARLRGGRERAGLSLIEAAEKLRVDPHALEALEAEQFEELGASVYVRGHLRHYAELVGESPLELQELYVASGHAVLPPDLTRLPHAQTSGTSRAGLVPGMAVVVVVALVGSAWWVAGSLGGSSSTSTSTSTTTSTTTSPPTAAGIAAPTHATRVEPRGTSPARVVATGRVLATHLAAPAAARGPSATEAAESLATAADAAADLPRRSAAAYPRVSELQLHFSEDSWAEVYDARGERLLFDVGSADTTRT